MQLLKKSSEFWQGLKPDLWQFIKSYGHFWKTIGDFIIDTLRTVLKRIHLPLTYLIATIITIAYGPTLAPRLPILVEGTWLEATSVGQWQFITRWLLLIAVLIAIWQMGEFFEKVSKLRALCRLTYAEFREYVSFPGNGLTDYLGAYVYGFGLVLVATTAAIGGAVYCSVKLTDATAFGVFLTLILLIPGYLLGGITAKIWIKVFEPQRLQKYAQNPAPYLRKLVEVKQRRDLLQIKLKQDVEEVKRIEDAEDQTHNPQDGEE
jgi:hypothetical protein